MTYSAGGYAGLSAKLFRNDCKVAVNLGLKSNVN